MLAVTTKQAVTTRPLVAGKAFVRELDHERHVRAIAVWFRIGGVLLALVAAVLGFGGGHGAVLAFVLGGVGAVSYALGEGIWSYRNVARWLGVGLAVLSMAGALLDLSNGFGVGRLGAAFHVLYDVAVIYVLTEARAQRIFSEGYRDAVARRSEKVAFWTSPFFYMPAFVLALSLTLLVAGTFALRG